MAFSNNCSVDLTCGSTGEKSVLFIGYAVPHLFKPDCRTARGIILKRGAMFVVQDLTFVDNKVKLINVRG